MSTFALGPNVLLDRDEGDAGLGESVAADSDPLARLLEAEARRPKRTTSLLARTRAPLREEHVLAPADSVLRRAVGATRQKGRVLLAERRSTAHRLDALDRVREVAPRAATARWCASCTRRGATHSPTWPSTRYGKLIDRNRKLVEDRLDDMLKAQRPAADGSR